MKPEAIDLLIEQKPQLKRARGKLEAMQPGAYCMHRAWGFGKIQSYDEADNKLVIDFEEDKPGHRMDPAFCVDKLEILPEGNILVRRRTHPEEIEEMIKKRQGDLVAEVLATMKDQTASPTELENLLGRLLGPTKFKKWWTNTKKILVKDPRIATPSKKTDPYVLREEELKPEQEILEDFYVLKQPKKKILLAEKLYQISDNVKEIEEDLPNIFDHLTEAIKDARGLNQAERLHGVWVRNDLARHLSEDPETIEPTSKSLILETEDTSELASNIPSAYQKRFLDLMSRVYPEDWKEVLLDILKNSSGKLTNETVNFMNERECEDLVAESFHKWLAEQSMKGPVIHWVVKNRNSRKYAKIVEGMIGPKLLAAMFYAIDYEALQNATVRRIQLADALMDDQELIHDLLEHASEEEARDLAQSLLLNQGFEDLTKKSLMARFIKLFPRIQSLLSGDEEEKTDELIVSQESLDLRKKEYEDLINKKIPENKEAIQIAREHGDLKENSEYKMARQDQDTLLARKAQLEAEVGRARVTDFSEAGNDVVGIGSIVEVLQKGASAQTFAILGAWDSAPERNILSYKTPLGQALLGHGAGETVQTEIDGNHEDWEIKTISRWLDSGQSL
ncbi:GreA/GreB family elongation factor [Rubellicoccus peritrichatus]|uniref:GreA/GreB family elongation factor n=1 Tax=Rubellicoccus peritrichatus TaxID=3080537 RepID=A0AAQ3L7N8_9BACT|nr:GreA/GreB family elongation factor [Puniceicoccus sp. CR14]WOO40760.1 GreA/GreB family elongation factor [Puniceicoccus sp. CR14]